MVICISWKHDSLFNKSVENAIIFPQKMAAWIIPLYPWCTESLFRTSSKKRRLGELDVFIQKKKKKPKRCNYVQKKRGEIFIKNSEWVYISIKKLPYCSQVSSAVAISQLYLEINIHRMETQVQELISTQILEDKIKTSRLLNVPSFQGNKAYSLQAYFLKKKKLTKLCH